MIFALRDDSLRPGKRAQRLQMIIYPSSTHSVAGLGHAWVSGELMIEPMSEKLRVDIFRLATVEARVIVAKLFWYFDFVIMPESDGWQSTQKGTVAWHRTPLMCKFKQRER